MPGPEDETAAAEGRGRGRLRASRADREQVVELLKAAFVEDRLTKEELDTRVGQALASRTYADLAAVTADIPAGLIAGQPREPVRVQGRPPMSKAAKAGISVAVAAAAPAVLSLIIGPLAFVMFAPFYVMGLAGRWCPDPLHAVRQALLQAVTARSRPACGLSAHGRVVRILAGGVRYAFIARLAAFFNGRRAAPQLAICSAPSVGYGQLLSR